MTPSLAPSSAAPVLSVLLCTRDRAAALRGTLESLCLQTLPRPAFEVVVVDDGSADATREVARAFESRLPLRYSHQRNAGIASARNHAAFLARGAVLLFLDEDVADPALLEAHLDAHRRFPETCFGVLGDARVDGALATDPLVRFLADEGERLAPLAGVADGAVLDFRYFRTGRSSCKRRFLLDHGVFNPRFRASLEDLELAWRLSKHQFRVVWARDALSTVTRRFAVPELCERMRSEGEARNLLAALHGDEVSKVREMDGSAGQIWERDEAYAIVVRSACELDRLARARLDAGLTVEEGLRELLGRSYLAAFRASVARGRAASRRGSPRLGP